MPTMMKPMMKPMPKEGMKKEMKKRKKKMVGRSEIGEMVRKHMEKKY